MKGLFGTIFAPRASAGVPSYGLIAPLGSVQSVSGQLVSQATAMGVSTVFACANRLATDLARCSPSIVETAADGSEIPVDDHPLLELFKRPNNQQTWFEWAWQMWVGHLLRGNGYSAVLRDRRQNPTELINVNPDAVLVLEASDGGVFYNVNRIGLYQIAKLSGFPTALAESDMLHFRGLTFNSLVGVSTIGLARDCIGLAMGLEQQAGRWIGNGARPSTWLKTTKQLSDATATRLKTQFDNLNGGPQNVGKTVVLEEGLEPVALQLTSVDLEFIAQRNYEILEICRFFGVPPHKVGVVDRGTVQNMAAQDQDYVNTSIMQKVVLFEQKVDHYFRLDKDGVRCKLDVGQLLRADILTRRNAARLGIMSGLTTQNEERRAEKLPPKVGGDDLLRPANSAAVGSEMNGQGADGGGRPAGGNAPTPGAGTSGDQVGVDKGANDTPEEN